MVINVVVKTDIELQGSSILHGKKKSKVKEENDSPRRRSKRQCRGGLDSKSATDFLGIEPALFGLLRALSGPGGSANRERRVRTAAGDSTHSDSVNLKADLSPLPEVRDIVARVRRTMETESSEFEIQLSRETCGTRCHLRGRKCHFGEKPN